MAITSIEDVEAANALFTLLERVKNLNGSGIISKEMSLSAQGEVIKALEHYFPPPEPPE